MKNTAKNFLFLGLPTSGKTTYFALMAQHLQDIANETNNLRFLYLPTEGDNGEQLQMTSRFIRDCIKRIEEGNWPDKTTSHACGYSFELDKYFSFRGKPLFQKYFYMRSIVDYHDYPGEVFEEAFGNAATKSKDTETAKKDTETAEDGKTAKKRTAEDITKEAKDMKEKIKSANGIFLILDADALFANDSSDEMLCETLPNLFAYIKNKARDIKVAVVFNKLELFYNLEIDFIKVLRKNYGNVYAHLPRKHKFFNVYTLGSVDTSEDGAPIPPKEIAPRGILEPVKWMLNF